MPRSWLLTSAFLLSLSFHLYGCGPKLTVIGGALPKTHVLKEISLSPSTTEILGTNGVYGTLKGRTASCDYPPSVKSLEIYAYTKPDYEKLRAAQPDLVAYDASLYSPAEIAKLKETVGADKLFEFHAQTIDEFETELRDLGRIITSPMSISTYIDKINMERATARSKPPAKPPKVAAFSGTLINGTKGFLADVIRASGGEPVGPDVNRFVANNPETLIQMNPDIILLGVDFNQFGPKKEQRMAAGQKAIDGFTADPRFKAIKAVASKDVYPVDASVLLRQGGRVDQLINALSKVVQGWASAR